MQIDDDLRLAPIGPVAPVAAAVAMTPVAAAPTIGTAAHLTLRSFGGLCLNCFGAAYELPQCPSPFINPVDNRTASVAALKVHIGVLTMVVELIVLENSLAAPAGHAAQGGRRDCPDPSVIMPDPAVESDDAIDVEKAELNSA